MDGSITLMALGAGLAWILSAVGSFFKARTERWQAESALHSEKQRLEFDIIRQRLEELHEKLEEFGNAYGRFLAVWKTHFAINEPSKSVQKPSPSDPLPEVPWQRITMIVRFYAPEIEPSIQKLLVLREAYLREVLLLSNGQTTGLFELEKVYLELYKSILEAQNDAVISCRRRVHEYLTPPDDPNDLLSSWRKGRAILRQRRKRRSNPTTQ
jgi:hypothetical protein